MSIIHKLLRLIKEKKTNEFTELCDSLLAVWNVQSKKRSGKRFGGNLFNCIVDSSGNRLLHQAAATGQLAIVMALLRSKKTEIDSLNNFSETPIMQAYQQGHFKVADFLKEEGAICPPGRFVLHYLIVHADISRLRIFAEEFGVKNMSTALNMDGIPILHFAAQLGKTSVIDLFVGEFYIPHDRLDSNQKTLLRSAQLRKQLEVVGALLVFGNGPIPDIIDEALPRKESRSAIPEELASTGFYVQFPALPAITKGFFFNLWREDSLANLSLNARSNEPSTPVESCPQMRLHSCLKI